MNLLWAILIILVFGNCIASAMLTVRPKRVEYREQLQVCGLKFAHVGEQIIQPFSSLRGWSVSFEKCAYGKLWIAVRLSQNDDISHAVIRKVQFTVRSGSVDYKSSDRDFPSKWENEKYSGLAPGLVWEIDSAIQDCMNVEVGLIFNDHEKQVKAVNEYLDSHPDTIGHLIDKDLEELKKLRQTEMKFYSDENESELVLTEMVDLHAMAQLSHYIRGLLRFNQHSNDGALVCPKSSKMVCQYFNKETITDLIAIAHGQQFKRSYFLAKSMDYLIRMGYISHQFDIPSLKMMMDDCIFNHAKWDQMYDRNLESIQGAVQYAQKTGNALLLKKIWGIFNLLQLEEDSPEYEQVFQKIVHM